MIKTGNYLSVIGYLMWYIKIDITIDQLIVMLCSANYRWCDMLLSIKQHECSVDFDDY